MKEEHNMAFKEIQPQDLQDNVFTLIGKDWLVVCGEKNGKANAMTASWGGMGVLWGKPVVFIFIRPQRYTKEFVDGAKGFTLSVLDESKRKVLNYLGTVSGRDEAKIEKAGLTPLSEGGFTYFSEARLALLCAGDEARVGYRARMRCEVVSREGLPYDVCGGDREGSRSRLRVLGGRHASGNQGAAQGNEPCARHDG